MKIFNYGYVPDYGCYMVSLNLKVFYFQATHLTDGHGHLTFTFGLLGLMFGFHIGIMKSFLF